MDYFGPLVINSYIKDWADTRRAHVATSEYSLAGAKKIKKAQNCFDFSGICCCLGIVGCSCSWKFKRGEKKQDKHSFIVRYRWNAFSNLVNNITLSSHPRTKPYTHSHKHTPFISLTETTHRRGCSEARLRGTLTPPPPISFHGRNSLHRPLPPLPPATALARLLLFLTYSFFFSLRKFNKLLFITNSFFFVVSSNRFSRSQHSDKIGDVLRGGQLTDEEAQILANK